VGYALAFVGLHPPQGRSSVARLVAEEDPIGVLLGDLGRVNQVVDIDVYRVQLDIKRSLERALEPFAMVSSQ